MNKNDVTFFIASTILLFMSFTSKGQSLPIDFESNVNTENFIDFDGGTAVVITNPYIQVANMSSRVAQIIRNGGQPWSGSKIQLSSNLDFGLDNIISMKVYTSAPVGTTVKFKLEGNGETERDAVTTVRNEWETLIWDFTGAPSTYRDIVFMFDFGNVGDGSANSTFLFDDVQQIYGGQQLDLPVTFEDADINYTTTDFGGNVSSITQDPLNANNTVIKVIKTIDAATWAGTTIGTPAGFASDIPLTLTDSKMTVKVWSPTAGTPIRLKVEDHKDPTHTCETQTNTTLDGEWEIIEFDFNNQATGTELLSIGLQMGWTYNMASIFFNFGTEGSAAGETTYYFDEVKFGDVTSGIYYKELSNVLMYPNPVQDILYIELDQQGIYLVEVYDVSGQLLLSDELTSSDGLDVRTLQTGIYFVKVSQGGQHKMIKLIRE